jgi:hypothetical protein
VADAEGRLDGRIYRGLCPHLPQYGGSLITATQSLNDYYKSEGSVAALENSDWSVILQQKPETITDFAKHGASISAMAAKR